jgi:glucose-6-phosphate isomerase
MLRIDFNNILSTTIGPVHGLRPEDLSVAISDNGHLCNQVEQERSQGQHRFLNLPYQDTADIEKAAAKSARRFDDFVVLGIGGSALGTITLHNALHQPFYNLDSRFRGNDKGSKMSRGYPRLHVLDNVDPEETSALLRLINPKKTMFNVISKSGETTETIATFLIALNLIKKSLGNRWKSNLIVTTDKEKGFLRRFAAKEGVPSFETPVGVEGRYSVLSPVALVPAAFTGINIKGLLKGAQQLDEHTKNTRPEANPAYLMALIHHIYDTKKNKNINILMPYSWQLKGLADWFRQLYPESIGKRFDINKNEVNVGPTVMTALGTTDQHSQIQLYNEGPNNKLITFFEVERFAGKVSISRSLPGEESAAFLGNHTLAELMQVEKRATEYALTKNQRPNYTIKLDRVSPEAIGALFYLFELMTAYAGKLYRVNPYNQPGVESGKQATFGLLGREGFTSQVIDVSNVLVKDEKWIVVGC